MPNSLLAVHNQVLQPHHAPSVLPSKVYAKAKLGHRAWEHKECSFDTAATMSKYITGNY